VIAIYERAGAIKSGSFAREEPSDAAVTRDEEITAG
jgi:hypothetical protein